MARKYKAIKQRHDGMIPLSVALRQIAHEKPWASIPALRDAVRNGEIPFIRSSFKKKARYHVRMSDLLTIVPQSNAEKQT